MQSLTNINKTSSSHHISSTTIITMKRKHNPLPPSPTSTTITRPLHPPPTPPQTMTITITSRKAGWVPLKLTKTDLSLPLTFPTGQTFLWKQTLPDHFTGPIGPHLFSLRQLPTDPVISFKLHTPPSPMAAAALHDFLNAHISLSDIWSHFSTSDPLFARVTSLLGGGGVRVLRQNPFVCLIQFLCSSNNNIKRITKMVDYLSSLGPFLGTVNGVDFYQFPSLDRLALVTEAQLRQAGFGYRAKYITGTVNALRSKPGGGVEWLESLRELDLVTVIDSLCTLPGVGPKVAACIALFSLDQHHAVPVDTHVWQIASKHLLPELAGTRLTPKLCSRVADAFVTRYGKYAGWAQTLLFIAELPEQKTLLPLKLSAVRKKNKSDKNTDKEGHNGD